ncbi:MAG: gephyrin-like molybdotransferase Glp [Candidatus Hadarchaeota archaeon]
MKKHLKIRTLKEVQSILSSHWEPETKAESISLLEAGGRILAEDVKSSVDLPPFDRSVYDGYAVRGKDTFGAEEENPVKLRLKGRVLAGQRPEVKVGSEECVEISTGAPMPEGADAVVMVEDTSLDDSGNIMVRRSVSPGENVSPKGSEIDENSNVARRGTRLTPQTYGSLLACGIDRVSVYKRPEVAVISIGEELVNVNSSLDIGQIYDVNGPTLSQAVIECGCQPSYQGILRDETKTMEEGIKKALDNYDAVLTSGGTSAGASDLLPEVIDGLGDPGIVVHGLAQKPGKPFLMAVVGDKPVFGLPGYPVSALMVFYKVVAPYLREMSGEPDPSSRILKAEISRKIVSEPGRAELVPVRVANEGGKEVAVPVREGSGAITSLSRADGFFEIPLEGEIVEAGELVEVELFGGITS